MEFPFSLAVYAHQAACTYVWVRMDVRYPLPASPFTNVKWQVKEKGNTWGKKGREKKLEVSLAHQQIEYFSTSNLVIYW